MLNFPVAVDAEHEHPHMGNLGYLLFRPSRAIILPGDFLLLFEKENLMSRDVRFIVVSSLLIVATLACNLSASQNSQPDLALTITAQALLIPQTGGQVTDTPVPAQTPASSGATVSISQTTNCRTGPSTAYDIVTSLNAGQQAVVIGKDLPDNYWIINNPNGNGTCWLWGQYATVSGDTNSLPQMSPPALPTSKPKPTKTPKPTATSTPKSASTFVKPPFPVLTLVINNAPNAPTDVYANRDSCTTGYSGVNPTWIEHITVTWKDNANNEDGYRVYRGNTLLSTLPANSTKYTITMSYIQNTGNPLYYTFGVQAYNATGVSAKPTWDVPSCP